MFFFVGQFMVRVAPVEPDREPACTMGTERATMAENLDARIGINLREGRLRAGFDLDALAGRTGLRPALLGHYEAGRQRVPVDVLARLAEALDRPVVEFFA